MKKGFLIIILLAFFAACWVLQKHPLMSTVKSYLQVKHVPSELLSFNKLGELFKELNVVRVEPNNSTRYKQDDSDQEEEPAGPFQKRRKISDVLLSPGKEHPLMAQARDDLGLIAGAPEKLSLAVVTEMHNLRGKKGIISNFKGRGRQWERLSYCALAKGNTLIFNSGAGIRLHGGKSRNPALPYHNYRLYFRKIYGDRELFSKEILPPYETLRTLVVHQSVKEDWPLNNVIANELYGMAGVETLEYQPVHFILNGKDQGINWLSPHLSRKFILQQEQLENIHYQRFKGTGTLDQYRSDLGQLAYDFDKKLTIKRVEKVVDLERLTNYFIAVAFSGNTDWNQGVAFRDADDQESTWRWIAWDLDHSFIDWYRGRSGNPDRLIWQQSGVELLFQHTIKRIRNRRLMLIRRLLNEDPQYRHHFLRRFVDVLNHQLSPDNLLSLYSKYRELLEKYGAEINPLLEDFFKHRQEFLRQELEKFIPVGQFYKVTLEAKAVDSLVIDGVTEELPYSGYYPARSILTAYPQQSGFWQVGDEQLQLRKLNLTISKDTDITFIAQGAGVRSD